MLIVAASPILEDLCATVGYRATRVLLAWFAGRDLYVPSRVDLDHPLRWLLGLDVFARLVEAWAGCKLDLPHDREDERYVRDRTIAERFASGATVEAVSAEFGLTKRRVQVVRAELVDRGWIAYAEGRASSRCGPRPKATIPGEILERTGVACDPPVPA